MNNFLENYFRFTDYQYDPELGDNYANYREQSPVLGRFFSPDPLSGDPGNPQSLNRYAYVLNNPMNAIDPLGLFAEGNEAPPMRCSLGRLSFVGNICELVASYILRPLKGDPITRNPEEKGDRVSKAPSAVPGGSTPGNCHITDPILGALEVKAKFGPEVQAGPVKAGVSMYKNVTTGESGSAIEVNVGIASLQGDNPTPPSGIFNAGGPQNIRYSASFLGFQYDFRSRALKFNPSKTFSLGVQLGFGVEVSLNSDTGEQIAKANQVCRSNGGH